MQNTCLWRSGNACLKNVFSRKLFGRPRNPLDHPPPRGYLKSKATVLDTPPPCRASPPVLYHSNTKAKFLTLVGARSSHKGRTISSSDWRSVRLSVPQSLGPRAPWTSPPFGGWPMGLFVWQGVFPVKRTILSQ